MKKITTIPFLNIESIPTLIKDFLTQKIAGFEEDVFNVENIKNQFEEKENSFSQSRREVLFQVLREQHSVSELSENQKSNLSFIKDKNAFTVTTGHQLNLFSGPVFFIYKILQTIKLANYLNENFPDKKVIPLFWMASEDHDFEEINHFKTENNYYEIKAKSGGAVGKIKVDDQYFITEFEKEFQDSVFGTELILLLKKAYKKENTLSAATRILVQELFADYGLLIIDGDHKALKTEIKAVFKEELLHQKLFNTTKETVSNLKKTYGKVQVNPRDINLFYLSKTRDRIELRNDLYKIVDSDISFSHKEIIEELENHPEKFSPNALMRPVYQETILPNLAYIGGNAEIMYWLELKNYFAEIDLPFPVLIPRNSILLVSEKTLAKTKKLDLEIEDFFKNFAEITKNAILENNEILALLNENELLLEKHFDEIAKSAEYTDKSFANLVQAEKTRQIKSFSRMKKRLLHAEKIKQNEKLERLENLFLKIHPGKNWQERTYNYSVFYSDYGKEWLQNCYEAIDVQNSELIIFSI